MILDRLQTDFSIIPRRVHGAWLVIFSLVQLCVPVQVMAIAPNPARPQAAPVAIVGGTIHLANGETSIVGSVSFDNGRITAVGPEVVLPSGGERIDATGKHVYPAMINAYSQIGLVEIDAVRATLDMRETGDLNPNVESRKAVNPDSELIPVARSNGVLLALTAPTGGLISGQSSVVRLDGWTWEDMTLAPNAAMHVRWPRPQVNRDWWKPPADQPEDFDKRRLEKLDAIDQAFEDARAYLESRKHHGPDQAIDARWEAMRGLLAGHQPMVVHADDLQSIQEAVALAQSQEVRLIIHGGYDAADAAELLKQHEVPVIVDGVYRLPRRRHEAYDKSYTLPERLRQAGVKYCIAVSQRFAASNDRNLPYHAGTAAAYGLSPDEALRAITFYPAEILGISDQVGSLDLGKEATLFIADGDILDTPTQVERAFVRGGEIDLSNRHKRLHEKYRERLNRERN